MASLLNYAAPTRDLTAPDAIEQLLTAAIAKRQPNAWNINDLGRARDDRSSRTDQLLEAISGANTMRDKMNTRQLDQEATTKIADIIADVGKTENPSAPDMSATAAALLSAMTGVGGANLPQMLMTMPGIQRVISQRGMKESTDAFKKVGEGTDSFDRAGVRMDEPKVQNFLDILQKAMTQGPSRDERREMIGNQGKERDNSAITFESVQRINGQDYGVREKLKPGQLPRSAGTPTPAPEGGTESNIRRRNGKFERLLNGQWVVIE